MAANETGFILALVRDSLTLSVTAFHASETNFINNGNLKRFLVGIKVHHTVYNKFISECMVEIRPKHLIIISQALFFSENEVGVQLVILKGCI